MPTKKTTAKTATKSAKKPAKKAPKTLSGKEIRTLTLPKSGRIMTYEMERKTIRRMRLRMRHDGTLHLSVPPHTTMAAVEAYLIICEDWYLKATKIMDERAQKHPLGDAVKDTLPYLGGNLTVVWQTGSPARVEADMENRRLTVTLPDLTNPELRAAAIETFEKSESKKLVTALVDRYHPLFAKRGVAYPKAIRVKVMKTRHGSCSSAKGYLNFSSRLCQYPLPFIEYVVVHELCHFLVPNHSDKFWREVERVLPDWKERDKLQKN